MFDRCEFRTTWLARPPGRIGFSRAERLDFLQCSVRSPRGLSRVECHQVLVRGVPKTSARVIANELLLDHVVLEGDIAVGWSFLWDGAHLSADELAYVERFYGSVRGFALDIRRARCAGLALRGVPGHLVRRDPATTALVFRDRLLADPRWCKLDEWGRPLPGASSELSLFLRATPRWPSHVLVAGVLGRRAEEELAELDELKRLGFAE